MPYKFLYLFQFNFTTHYTRINLMAVKLPDEYVSYILFTSFRFFANPVFSANIFQTNYVHRLLILSCNITAYNII
jgi:hypothetical protein